MNEHRLTSSTWDFDFDDVGKEIKHMDGSGRRLTIARVDSPYSVVLIPRRWWHRYRLARWAFFEPNSMEDTR